ncbi:hypothetical protein CTEN210_04903 [Chaetoceros tenuissimus]|uniref:Fungal lipase-type domain-containing protein n=1 Tax=Chaetoceros tenuissimus TaxID=426638 RepID=A0AAD3CLV6_9STRA|nr:hypothetical protein CTEN210_04903 [Chaetoceros tenuissimus]
MSALSSHSSLLDLMEASKKIQEGKGQEDRSNMSKTPPSGGVRPVRIAHRRMTTGSVVTGGQERTENESHDPTLMAASTTYSPNKGDVMATTNTMPQWNMGPASPIRRYKSQGAEPQQYIERDVTQSQSYDNSTQHQRVPSIGMNIPDMNRLSMNHNQPAPISSGPFLNPFEDPAIIGDLNSAVPLATTTSFPKAEDVQVPTQHLRSSSHVYEAASSPSHPLNTSTPHPLQSWTAMTDNTATSQPLPQPIMNSASEHSTGLPATLSPSHKHSQFDPLLNSGSHNRSSSGNDVLRSSIPDNIPTHKHSMSVDAASLANLAAELSTLKPQKQEADGDDKKTANNISEKKNRHRRFLSQPFSNKGKGDDAEGEKGSHRRSISAGFAAVFKRDDENGEGRASTPGKRLGRGRRMNKNEKNIDSALEIIASESMEDSKSNAEIKLRSSEQDPSLHQVTIPSPADLLYPAKLCQLFEQYRVIDQNFDFHSLVGIGRVELETIYGNISMSQSVRSQQSMQSRPTSPSVNSPAMISPSPVMTSRPTSPSNAMSPPMNMLEHQLLDTLMTQNNFVQAHAPIIESIIEQDDLIVEGFFYEQSPDSNEEKSSSDRIEVAIFKNDSKRHFLVAFQGCAESQLKPIKKNEQKDGIEKRFAIGRKDDDNKFSEEEPVTVFPPFRKAYFGSNIEDKLFERLDQLLEENPFFDVISTGHSFGGAMAILSSMRYANTRGSIMISSYVFGCPKIGNLDFRYYVNSLPNLRIMRVEYGNDPWINAPEHPMWSNAGHALSIINCSSNDNADTFDDYNVRALKFGDSRPDSKDGKKIVRRISRHANKEKQLDHDISSYVLSIEHLSNLGIVSGWPRHFVGEEGSGVQGLDKEKRLVC